MKKVFLIFICIGSVGSGHCSVSNDALRPGTSETPEIHLTPIDRLNTASAENSHAGITSSSSLELDFRTRIKLGQAELGCPIIAYPRIKRLADGRYMLLYQSARIGADIFCALSDDAIHWERTATVFSRHKGINGAGEEDEVRYSSADAVVLDNGDILAIASFRCNKGYYFYPSTNGIALRRSTDNGQTWGEEQTIFQGSNWEPFPIQLPSGEILVFFTDNDPAWTIHDSGTSLLRSSDNGESWTQQCHVIRQYRTETTHKLDPSLTRKVYTDQMPTACRLNGGNRMLAALESMAPSGEYHISFAWSSDNWSETLTGDKEGPAERQNNLFRGCAPYLLQFLSGETVLSYNIGSFYMRIGNPQGSDFASARAFEPFGTVVGYWGSTEKIDEHALLAAVPDGMNSDSKSRPLLIGRLRLNHAIDAPRLTPGIDGDNRDWGSVNDALFLGSETQAQATFRFVHDERYLYILTERHDNDISIWDHLTFRLGDGKDGGDRLEFTVSVNKDRLEIDRKGIDLGQRILGTPNDQSDTDEGCILEIAVPRKLLKFDLNDLRFSAEMIDDDTPDTFDGLTAENGSKWFPIRLK